jgi:hypothetical protein
MGPPSCMRSFVDQKVVILRIIVCMYGCMYVHIYICTTKEPIPVAARFKA